MRFTGVAAVMHFVDDPVAAVTFWAKMLDAEKIYRTPRFAYLRAGDVEMAFQPSDERNPAGGSPAVYWRVERFNKLRNRLLASGCRQLHYPREILGGRQMCQFMDPFGIVFGIDGPANADEPVWPEFQGRLEARRQHSVHDERVCAQADSAEPKAATRPAHHGGRVSPDEHG